MRVSKVICETTCRIPTDTVSAQKNLTDIRNENYNKLLKPMTTVGISSNALRLDAHL